ncbi:DUF4157 domain-containing protein [Nitrosomonas sp.]|uniref:eCIS core domain-containing protein n=1 Tax=Nitrosomonas sp. TaxID=42353 RepID=UPI0026151FD0|nr:DUF4157 domain-containing protein [Nitrosomonas sp.]MCW5599988.1 DUF4157 domain-containing protein [Nitrosomonas sp.]
MKAAPQRKNTSTSNSTAGPFFQAKPERTTGDVEITEFRQPTFFHSSQANAAGGNPLIQPKRAKSVFGTLESGHTPFFQYARVPAIQTEKQEQREEKNSETLPVLCKPIFESEEDSISSHEDEIQRKAVPGTEAIAQTSVTLQPKCTECEAEEKEQREEQGNEITEVQRMPAFSSAADALNPGDTDEPAIQFSLKVGQPGDRYEREADTIAERVVAIPKEQSHAAPELQTKLLTKAITPFRQHQSPEVQPKCTACEAEEVEENVANLQRKPLLQKQADGSLAASGDATHRLQRTQGSGQRLDKSTRTRMESAFGTDLSSIRIHTDSQAIQLNRDLGAQAFTHGSDVYFNSGKYDPHSKSGERLLAHELTHTVQQGATPTTGKLQTNLIQRDTECEAEEEERGSEEQAQQAETAPNIGDCRQTNPPAEEPPEGTAEPTREETPADVEAREGAPVDERQSNAPPPNENAPEGEEGIAETAEQTEPTAPQDPCAVREAAGAGGTETRTTPTPAGGSAPEAEIQPATTPAIGGAPVGATAEGGEEATAAAPETEANGFLVEVVQGAAANLQPEGRGEAASPDVAAERDELSVSADEALSTLNETSLTAAFITTGGLRFIAPIKQTDDPAAHQQSLADHQSASFMADTFLSRAGQRLNSFIAQGIAAAETLRAGTDEKKVALMANIQQRRARTQVLMEQLRASAQAQAQSATQQIEARHLETIMAIDLRAMAAQTEIEPIYEEQVQQLEQAQTDQMTRLDEVYQTAYNDLLRIGREKGQQAMDRAREHELAYRRAEGATPEIQRRVQNEEKDGFWDGYLTYNRYMARADAAKKVGEEYRDGFQNEAQAQADNMMCGKPRDIEMTQTIINQSLESLGCARDNAIDSIENQRQFALDMAERTRQEAINTIQNALRATLNQLNEREAGQLQLIQDYGIRQEMAIERDSERVVGTVLKGVNDAALQILQYLGQFRDQIESTEAPPPDVIAAQLAIEDAQLTASFDRAQAAFDQTLNQTQTSLDTGQMQALGALEQLYQRGADEAQQLASSFQQTAQDLVAGTLNGYDQILVAFDERIVGEIANSTQILQGVVVGAISVFERINTGIGNQFQQSASQMQLGMQRTLDEKLDQKVCAEAEKAAADVQPWWKTVLKVLLIIVVIVVVALVLGPAIIGAVGAAATALAGSLGVGAALAGTIGAWVGPIIGGAIVGAIAGAAIQLGSNAIYNKPLTEGLWGAVIAGAIGGALGGVGGQLGQVLVGRFASTAFSRIAIQYGTDVVFDVVGGILGDLAAGNPITWESIVMGLAIGGAVQLSMGGLGSLAGRSRAARAAGAAEVPEGVIGRVTRGRLGRAAERITDLQGRAMAAGERFGARVGGRGGRAPTAEATSEALASARARMEEGEAFPTRGGPEPEGWPRGARDIRAGQEPVVPESVANAQEGAVRFSTDDGHNITVSRDGPLLRCSDPCEIINFKYRDLIEANPQIRQDIQAARQFVDSDPALAQVKAQNALDALARLRALEVSDTLRGIVDDTTAQNGLARLAQHNKSHFDELVTRFGGSPDDLTAIGRLLESHPNLAREMDTWPPRMVTEVGGSGRLRRWLDANPNSGSTLHDLYSDYTRPRPAGQELASGDFSEYVARRGLPIGPEVQPVSGTPRGNLPEPGTPAYERWQQYRPGRPPMLPCFPPGTIVKTPLKDRTIENILPGDLVYAFDFETNEPVLARVKESITNWTQYLISIFVDDQIVKATKNHRFWVVDLRRWMRADQLTIGMEIKLLNGETGIIANITKLIEDTLTHNLEVEKFHNYYVGEIGLLVHNDDGSSSTSKFSTTDTHSSTVYVLRDGNRVIYVGQTISEEARFRSHLSNPESAVYQYLMQNNDAFRQIATSNPETLTSLDMDEFLRVQRPISNRQLTTFELSVWEQYYIDLHGGIDALENRINAITPEKLEAYRLLHNPCE